MGRKYWQYGQVEKLKAAVKNYKQQHGNSQICWNTLREESQLLGFTAVEIRQKYSNILKKRNEGPDASVSASKTVSAPQRTGVIHQGNQNAVQGTVQTDQINAAEINRIATAALKVRPRTAIGFEFRKNLGYDGGSDRTHKLFLDRLMAAVKEGLLGPNWLADLAKGREKIPDWGREERRDIAKLTTSSTEIVLDDGSSNTNADQCQVQASTNNMQSNDAGPKIAFQKSKGVNRHYKIQVASCASVASKLVAVEATDKQCLPTSSTNEFLEPPPKKRHNESALFNDPIIGPYGVVLPSPTGYGSNHVSRKLADNEWRKIFLEIKQSRFNILSDAYNWKKMVERAGVTCSIGGLEIQLNFCKYAIPRLKELTDCLFDDSDNRIGQTIFEPCRLTDIFVFHSLTMLKLDQIMPTLRELSDLKCISVADTSLSTWCTKFVANVLKEGNDYFRCKEEDLVKLKEDVIETNLQYCSGGTGQ